MITPRACSANRLLTPARAAGWLPPVSYLESAHVLYTHAIDSDINKDGTNRQGLSLFKGVAGEWHSPLPFSTLSLNRLPQSSPQTPTQNALADLAVHHPAQWRSKLIKYRLHVFQSFHTPASSISDAYHSAPSPPLLHPRLPLSSHHSTITDRITPLSVLAMSISPAITPA